MRVTAHIFTLHAPHFDLTPEVVKLHFSNRIAGRPSRRNRLEMQKASRKWLAFNAFSSGGRIRTSDLRVMSAIDASRATP